MLSRANAHLAATLVLMKDAREKFDTVADCQPSIERLHKGVVQLQQQQLQQMQLLQQDAEDDEAAQKLKRKMAVSLKNRIVLTEQDVYAAGDSLEILRDAYDYFLGRSAWRSAPTTLTNLERLHKMGTDSMCLLVEYHLQQAGPAVRPKRNAKLQDESAEQVSV